MSNGLARTVGGPISGTVTATVPDPLPVSAAQLPPALVSGRLVIDGSEVTQPVAVVGPIGAFGEVIAALKTPVTQGAFVFNLNTELWTPITFGAAAATAVASGIVSVSSGTAAGGYAIVRSRYTSSYRSGQGSLVGASAMFSAPVANNRQLVGIGNPESGYYFGYNGATFGILHVANGTRAIQTLTITTKSSTAENVTVTLDGTPVLVPVTNGASTITTAWEIAKGNYSQCGANGWDAQALGSVVYFLARQCNAAVGTVAVAGTTVGGVGAIVTAAAANSEVFTPQGSWNGSALSVALAPSNINTYSIDFQYAGDAYFYINDETTGRAVLVHTIRNSNTRTTVSVRQPSCNIEWISRNTGNLSSVSVQGTAAYTAIEGDDTHTGVHQSASAQATIGAATLTPVISVTVTQTFQSRASRGQIRAIKLSAAATGAKPTTFYVLRDATLAGSPNFTAVNTNTSFAATDTAASGVSGGVQIFAASVGKDGDVIVDISDLDVLIEARGCLTIAALSANAADVAVSLAWTEE